MGGIVVGVDGSAHAVDALRFAIEECRFRSCPLLVVEVWQLPFIAEDVGTEAAAVMDEPARQRAAQVLQAQVDKALDGKPAPENMQVELRTGHPVEVLVRLGRTADLLIVGARGRGGFRQLLTGSVATQLVNHAPCPVTVVPSGPAAARGWRRRTRSAARRRSPTPEWRVSS
jgi:nucleotide-binding universal stress UspA family protein